jgi:hypothetical protein
MRILVYLDTGDTIGPIPDQNDPIGSYIQGFRDGSPSLSFEVTADRWTVIPTSRVVAIEALPDLPAPPDDEVAAVLEDREIVAGRQEAEALIRLEPVAPVTDQPAGTTQLIPGVHVSESLTGRTVDARTEPRYDTL